MVISFKENEQLSLFCIKICFQFLVCGDRRVEDIVVKFRFFGYDMRYNASDSTKNQHWIPF